jgi:hypothetical protein
MTNWVEKGSTPPPDQFVPDPHTGDIVNSCALARSAAAPAAGGSTPAAGHRLRPRVTLRVSPRRDRRAPYRFRISGRVLLPGGVTRAQACGSGTVSLKLRSRNRTAAAKRAKVGAKCRFRTRFTLKALRRGRPLVKARFNGNRALLPATARRRARIG